MKKPENFRKIDGVTFTTRTGNKYKFSIDTPKGNLLWIFFQPDTTTYSLAFVIDWEKEVYEIRRAKNGDGKNWVDTIHQGNFGKDSMKTPNAFVDWVHYRVLQFEHEYNNL